MRKITDTGMSETARRKVLNFLNSADSVNDLLKTTYVDIATEIEIDAIRDRDLAKTVLLVRDTKFDGEFTKLDQLNEVKGFDKQELSELVEILDRKVPYAKVDTVEPLFRFATLRYHDYNNTIQSKKAAKAIDNKNLKASAQETVAVHNSESRLKRTEKMSLEKAHLAVLANHEIQFLKSLANKIETLKFDYYETKESKSQVAQQAHDQLNHEKMKGQQSEISEKEDFEQKSLPVLNFEYPEFISKEYLADKLTSTELEFIAGNRFFGVKYFELIAALNKGIESKQLVAAYPEPKWHQTINVLGVEVKLKNKFKNGYVLSKSVGANSFLLSVVADQSLSFSKEMNASITLNGKSFKTKNTRLISNESHFITYEITFDKLPALSSSDTFEYSISLILKSGERFNIQNEVASNSTVWAGKYSTPNLQKNSSSASGGDMKGLIRLGWADLMRVEQQLCCYLPGEIAHIENIMAREYKEKSTEILERSEYTITTESETETIEKNDTTSVGKHDWNKEVKKVVNNSFKFNLGTSASFDLKPWTFNINASLSFSNTRDVATTNAQSFSKSITESASESIRTREFEKRTTTLIKQFKETNKHGFDNREGDNHVSGIFRWIDKEYKNQIVNYGKGMLYEFMVPKPAELYLDTLSDDTVSDEPVKPEHPGINSWEELTRDNYKGLVNKYQVSNYQAPMDSTKTDRFETGLLEEEFVWSDQSLNKSSATRKYTFNSNLAAYYDLTDVLPTSNYRFEFHNPFGEQVAIFQIYLKNTNTNVKIAERNDFDWVAWNGSKNGSISATGLSIANEVDVYILGHKLKKVNHATFDFQFTLKNDVYVLWQQATHTAIMDAYNDQLQAYQDALLLSQSQVDTDASLYGDDDAKNPGAYREIIETELKRLCVELLLQKSSVDRCKEFYVDHKCNDSDECESLPVLTNLDDLDDYASIVKFVEQAFLWSLMSYNLYPYFWAGKCDWEDMIQNEDTTDNDFQRFIKSGMARTIVPVREGFEKVVGYFMSTGSPWFGGEPPTIDDPLYVSIVEELKRPVGTPVGKPWKTNVPSTLTLLQGKSAYLNEQGLPCNRSRNSNLLGSDHKLEAKDEDDSQKPE